MLIVGWGGNCKVMGEVGLVDCPNCNNTASWQVVETSKQACLYFVRVAKWKRQYFCVCPVCSCGTELQNREQAQDVLLRALESHEKSKIANAILREAGIDIEAYLDQSSDEAR